MCLVTVFCDLQELWEEAGKYPLHGMLHDSSSYSIIYVNSMAQREMLIDENKRLCDVRPFVAVLNFVERQEDKADNVLNAQISNLIGKGIYCFAICLLYAHESTPTYRLTRANLFLFKVSSNLIR